MEISAEKRGADHTFARRRNKLRQAAPDMSGSWGRTGFDGDEEVENRGPRRRWPRKKRQPK